MAVPNRVEAARLLCSLNPPAWFLRHSRGVAEVAAWLAARATAAAGSGSLPLDRDLVEAAALLHDVDKLLPPEDPARRLPHGPAGAAWLTREGFGELAGAVAAHPVTRLGDDDWWEAWHLTAPLDDLIVAYADKRVGQRLGTMAARFSDWERRYPIARSTAADAGRDAETATRVRARADELERRVTRALGILPAEVGRLRWTSAALRLAGRV